MNVIIFDTETAPTIASAGIDAKTSLVYDLGWCVLNTKSGEIVDSHSITINDTFSNAILMQNAYYSAKLPQYFERMRNGYSSSMPLREARAIFADDVKKYNVRQAWAYNCKFDYQALNNSVEVYSNGYVKHFFPFGLKICDLWAWAGNSICATQKFVRWCASHGFMSAKGNPKTSAEVVYAYLNDRPDYIEEHTALEDAKIEAAIYLACAKRRAKSHRDEWGRGWQVAAKTAKAARSRGLIPALA